MRKYLILFVTAASFSLLPLIALAQSGDNVRVYRVGEQVVINNASAQNSAHTRMPKLDRSMIKTNNIRKTGAL